MPTNSPSSTTTFGKTTNPQIGRPIPDNPASLAAVAPAKLPGSPSTDSINSGMSVGSQVVVGPVKRVGIYTTTPDDAPMDQAPDVSAAFSTDAFKNQGGPRVQQPGQQNSKFYLENGKAFKSTGNAPDSDAGN
jgi:hypothetical protein